VKELQLKELDAKGFVTATENELKAGMMTYSKAWNRAHHH
jgi:hypothetical protein